MTITVDEFKKWSGVIHREGIVDSFINSIGWLLANLLSYIADACQDLLDATYQLLNFAETATIYKIFQQSEVKIIIIALMTISLLYLAFTMILGDKKKPPIVMNLVALLFVLFAMPTFMKDATSLIDGAKNHLLSSNASISQQVKANYIIDLRYIDSQGIQNYTPNKGYLKPHENFSNNGFSEDYSLVDYIDVNETLSNKSELNTPDLFFSAINIDKVGNVYLEEIKKKSFLGIFDMTSYTYRYDIDYISMYIALIAVIVAFFFTAFKTVQLLYELVLHHTIGVIVGSADLHGGQKIRKLIVSVIQIFATLFFTIISLKFFLLLQNYINTNLSNVGLLARSILLLFVSYAVIDGANILQVLFGIDAGLKSAGFATLAAAKTMFNGANKVKNGAKNLLGKSGDDDSGIDSIKSKNKDDGSSNLKNNESKNGDLKNIESNNTSNNSNNNDTNLQAENNNDSSELNSIDNSNENNIDNNMSKDNENSTNSDISESNLDEDKGLNSESIDNVGHNEDENMLENSFANSQDLIGDDLSTNNDDLKGLENNNDLENFDSDFQNDMPDFLQEDIQSYSVIENNDISTLNGSPDTHMSDTTVHNSLQKHNIENNKDIEHEKENK